MKKDTKVEFQKPFKLSHQTLCITAINFKRQTLMGYVELTLHPQRNDLRKIRINSKQCRIYRVCISDTTGKERDASFEYSDPTLEICQGDAKQRNLDFFQSCHVKAMAAVDPDNGTGEVTIRMPPEVLPLVTELKPLRVCIEFSLEQPSGGIHFVVPVDNDEVVENACHMFTYGHENSSRLWFPCLDSFSEVCTWKLEFTVPEGMVAVSCGDLVECHYNEHNDKMVTYHYYMSSPTAAPNIALAVGAFETHVDPHMHEVTLFCLPRLGAILKASTTHLHEAFEFYEELLSSPQPYSCYKQVFVDESYVESASYATMTIFSTNILHSSRIIDQVWITRKLMASAIAQQFFGCFVTLQSWSDHWLTKGIAGYLSALYVQRTFGNNEYRHFIASEMKTVSTYEQEVGGIVLDSSGKESWLHFSTRNPHTVSPRYLAMFARKAQLVIRMLEFSIGKELLLQVFNKVLGLANTAAQQKYSPNAWNNMLVSTQSFLKIIYTVTGKDITPFIEQWVYQSGVARFTGSFRFHRKRNVVELEIKQEMKEKGTLKYAGPLNISIQELDGPFSYKFNIEENKTSFEITCHSKSRRNKKKKIPLSNGEEIDMDLAQMDPDSPVLWLRIDPDLQLLRAVDWEQPDYMWQYQLKHERDVIAQMEATVALEKFSSPETRSALNITIENDRCFYKVRMEACMCLSKVANEMPNWQGPPAMQNIFHGKFGSHSCPNIIRLNNFSNFQHYFLQKTMPFAMALLRNNSQVCPQNVTRMLFDLLKYNDNSKNKYSDNYYRASLIDALGAAITPAATSFTVTGSVNVNSLHPDIRNTLEEVTQALNTEKLLPVYRHVISVSCLGVITRLIQFGHIPPRPDFFKSYAQYGIFRDIRMAALKSLIQHIRTNVDPETLSWVLDLVEKDPDRFIRHHIVQLLIEDPPFKSFDKNSESSPLNTEALVERLWKFMNSGCWDDSRLRCGIADLYYALYGRLRPNCLPIPETVMVLNLKEKTTLVNPAIIPSKPETHSQPVVHHQEPVEAPPVEVKVEEAIQPAPIVEPEPMDVDPVTVEEVIPLILPPPVETPIKVEVGSKRPADTPLRFPPPSESLQVTPIPSVSEEGSGFKLRIKIGSEPAIVPSSPSPSVPAAPVTSTPKPPIPKQTDEGASHAHASTSGSVLLSSREEEMSRLSEDSMSPPHPSQSSHSLSHSASLSHSTSTAADTPDKPPVTRALTIPPLSISRCGSSTMVTSSAPLFHMGVSTESQSSSRSHREKKKKKKNKHKHKHKHKHEHRERERGERSREPSGSDSHQQERDRRERQAAEVYSSNSNLSFPSPGKGDESF